MLPRANLKFFDGGFWLSVILACRESFCKARKDAGQAGMTDYTL
jgi:hypothetical protein